VDNSHTGYDYTVFSGVKRVEGREAVRVFGLRVRNGVGLVTEVPDICTDEEKLSRLAEELRRGQLSPIHLPDVIEDFLG